LNWIQDFFICCLNKTSFRLVSWQQQSCPSHLLKSAQCAKSWEVCIKYEKMCKLLICSKNAIFFSKNDTFFGVKENFFWARSTNFCCLMVRVLPPFVGSFAVFSRKKILSVQYKLLPPYGTSFVVFCCLM